MPEKKYLIEIPGQEEVAYWGATRFDANKDQLLKDHPNAIIAEIDSYAAEDANDNDSYIISIGESEEPAFWDSKRFNANKEQLLKDHPTAQIQRVRGYDYFYNQAISLEEALADNKKRKEAWEARRKEGMSGASLAEIAALEAGLAPIVGTYSEGAAAAQAYLDEGRQIEEERIRLQEQYDNNPRVKEAQEKWEKEQAEYKAQYPQLLREQVNKDYQDFLSTVPQADRQVTLGGDPEGFNEIGRATKMLFGSEEQRNQQAMYDSNNPLFVQALTYIDEADKIANAPSVADETNGFVKYLKTMGDRFSETDFWSRGLYEADALAKGGNAALTKFQQIADEKGDNLTEEDINAALSPAEKAFVLALTHKIAVQAERANEFASDDVKLSRAYNLGRGTADIVGYMAEFLLSGSLSGGASKTATNAVAKWLIKNGVSRLTRSALKGTAGKAAVKAISKNALKGASKVLTNILSKSAGAVVGGAARTPFTLSLAGNIADRRTSVDENGRFHDIGESAIYGTFDTAVENFSEEMGGAVGDLLGVPFKAGKGAWKAMTRNVDFGKIGGAAKRAGDFAQRVANSKAFTFLKNAGFHGPIEEVGEEFVGAAVRDVTIEPGAWEQTANKESVIDLMVTFAPMTALGMVGTAGQMIHVSNEAKSKMDKLAQLMLAKGFDKKQVDYLTDYMRSTTPEKLRQEMVGIWTKMANESGLGANVMQSEIGKAVIEAAYATAQYQTLFGAKQAQEAQQRDTKRAELEEKYNGKFYGEDGMVRRHTLSNGKTVFQISNFGENGEAAAIDAKTGEHIIFKESDIAVETDKDGKQHNRSDSQTLDSYLSGEVMALNTTWERARMQKDRQDQINALAQSLPATINLGTQGDSKMLPIKGYNANGVEVVDENGNEIALTWEQVGQKLGKPIKVLTDAEIAEIEAQEIAMRSNERKAGRAQTQQEVADTETEINDTNKRIADLTPNPEEAYRNQETGEIDEDAFWENDPEGWADYNDRTMMDNGQDTMEQIESGLSLLAKQMSELDKMKSDSPNARKTIKAQKANLQTKIDRLVALQQKYVQASVSEEQRKVELTLALRERVAGWRKRLGLNEEGLIVFESIEDVINSPYLSEKEKADVLEVIGRGKTEGWYNTASTRAFVFLPDINTAEELDKTIAHEVVTHYGLHNLMGEKAYNELMDKVWDTMSDAARNAYYNYPGVASMQDADKRRRAAAEEFVASIAENVSLDQATAEQKSIWQRIVEFFRNLFKESNFSDVDIADIVRKNYQQLTEQAAQESVEEFKAEAQEQRENGIIPELIETEAQQADGTKLYSTATYHSWVDNLGHEHTGTREEVLTRMQNMGFSEAEIEDMAQRMDTAYAYMEKLRRLTNPDGTVRFDEFNKWAEKTPLYKQIGRDYVKAITSLVSNGDYPVNLEITTDCIKREAFTQLLNELVKRGAELSGMGPGEIVTIQKMMKQYGIEVACNLCFVEGKRLQIINWASQIVNDWNDALVEAGVETDEFFEFGKDGDAFIPADEWRTYEDKSKVAKVMRNLDDIALLFQGLDPKTFKAQKRKNKKALDKYIKEKAEKAKKPVDQWKPSDEQKREMKKIANEGLYPTYVNENMEEYRNAFNAMRNEWLDKNPNADPLSFNPTQKQWEALGKIRNRQIDNVRAKMVRLIMEYPEMRKKMTLNDLLGSKGLMEIRQQHGQAYADLYSIILQRFGTGTPKPVQDAVPYDGEVMTLSESAFKKANEIGGARLFSFSDFDITKVFDYMQMFFDLEANRQMLQSYTKEVAAVLIFGRSNAKFNISTLANAIVPDSVKEEYNKASEEKKQELRHKWAEYAGLEVDAEGNIIGINFSEEHSVSPAFAQQIFHDDSRNKDCGAIMVGASVNHAIFSAAQQWIRMVIPFHLSGMPLAAREKTDVKWYTDNTAYQSTRKKTKDGWSKISSSEDTFKFYNDMSKEGWNMRDKTREYLAWCAEKGFRPKFDWGINSDYYRAYCEENGYTPNQQIIDIMDADTTDGVWNQYYKFLTDFTAYKPVFNEQGEMIDEIPSPQLPVQSNFDFSEMERDVLFEGERSMLEHREGNIQRTNRHIEILAEQATAYLNGDITEEEMGLRDDVHFENTADAERYLEEVAKENGTNMYKTRTDSEREKLFADAKEKFGVTNNFKVAGYMLPDGSLLDFSEANDGGDPNQRSLDHRSIEDVIMEDGTEYDSRWMYLADFMNEGAIRLLPEYAGINLMKAPTKEQRQRLMDFIYKYNGEVILEIADDRLNNAAYVEYDSRTSPARIFRDIDGYFNEGIVPQSNTMFKTSNNNQAIFVSNAAKAVEGIKMEKATPEQWLKMIEKNGGLKAGEDKWMGLSDWLKASDKKTLTKQDVLDFVNEHMIQIEEQHYGINLMEDREQALHDNMIKTYGEDFYKRFVGDAFIFEDSLYGGDWHLSIQFDDTAADLYNEYNEDKVDYNEDEGGLSIQDKEKVRKWATAVAREIEAVDEVRQINPTRKKYSTGGLRNHHEIALTIPTIESWNKGDDVHFGDAGEGRAVAWIRFGDGVALIHTEASKELHNEVKARLAQLREKYGEDSASWSEEEREQLFDLIDAARKAKRESKVLVIDEIQSQRHQDAKDGGYRTKVDEKQYKEKIKAVSEKQNVLLDYIGTLVQKYPNTDYDIEDVFKNFGAFSVEEKEELKRLKEEYDAAYAKTLEIGKGLEDRIPEAPFEKNWAELAMKRMLRYAAENGYDAIAWTEGEQQVRRYQSLYDYESISVGKWKTYDGAKKRSVDVLFKDGTPLNFGIDEKGKITRGRYKGEKLTSVLSKEVSKKIMAAEGEVVLTGEDLTFGEGMKHFYDKMLPSFMNKYGKKWGVSVDSVYIKDLGMGLNMHSVPVTDEMKESVMEGQTMFKTRQPNQSSEEFCLDCMRDYVRKYGYVTIIKVEPVNDATAKKYGYTLDELKELSGLYDKRIVVIFAKEDITDSDEVESTIFHESIHHLAKRYKSLIDTGKLFWNLADRIEELSKIREYVEKNYPDNSQEGKYEEMLCFTMEFYAGTTGLDFIVEQLRGQSKKDVELIINKTNYGRSEQTEAVRQDTSPREDGADNDRQNGREGEGAGNEAGEAQQGDILFKTAITPEVRREMDVISAQAIVNGNYMKAPNGKDSKLTPEQWAMVRTKNFLNWAGDWINDPENAAVVLDVETREPLVLYHGTPRAGFTEFKSGWFTTSKEDAISYSGDRKGRMFDPNEKYEPETLTAGDFRLGYMTFDSEEDRAAFLAEHPTAESAMSESEYENARMQADEEYDALTERKPELQKIWDAYREYERDHFVDTTIGEILNNPDAYTEDDLRRAVLAYDSNAVFDSIDELETTEERKSALVESLNYMNEDAKENGAEGILDMVVATRVPRNGEGVKHNDLGNRTYEVYARIERPYEIDANGRGSEFESGDIYQSVKDALADEQYDGVIIRNWRVGKHQQLGDVVVPKYGGNQVKLTSNENPTESEDIRFRFIGKKGAANIDKATQETWTLDNLARAQKMESKFDAKTIKRATGWEKGMDGKWRYEEPDNITLKEDKVQELYDNYEFNKKKEKSGDWGSWKEESCLLPELIDAPELFRAYPELKTLYVRLNDRGFASSWGGTIVVNVRFFAPSAKRDGYKSINDLLLHELQHEIQKIEGFAKGGSIDTADQIRKNAKVWAWKLRAEEVAKKHPEFKKSEVKKFLEEEFDRLSQDDWMANRDALKEGTRIYTLGQSSWNNYAKDYELLKSIDESDYETYYRLAGEVEARNVTARAKMSSAERKYRLASETEDRDRSLQIVSGVTADEDIRFKTRTAPAPTKTQDVYKLMRLGADGKLYPLFIGSAEPIELGTWYDAESPNLGDLTKLASGVHLVNNETGEAMTLDEFKAQHPEITIKGKRPNVDAINWATENGARWIEIEDKTTAQRRYEGESRSYYNLGINGSGQVGQFAMRPGWHAGSLPTMRQIGKGKDKNLRDDSFVWVKGRIPADVDYQSEADANPDKDIPTHIPTDGFYMKATNANAKASQADKMGWYVAGSFIADEIISDAEARRVIDSWNAEHPDAKVEYDYERESGREYDPKRGGLVEKENIMFKTTHERALRGLVTLESSGASFEAVQQIIKNRLDSIQKQVAKLNKLPDSEHVQKRIAALQEEFEIAERQELMLNETASKLIDETLVEPDYESALSDMTPRNADEAIAQALTMSVDAATRKKVGIMLAPESLANELGWSKDDWKGLSYIVSDKGISIDRLAEMLGEDSELEHIFSGMDTMDIKDAIIDFLMGMMTYADIRDYTKNARMKEAKDEAEAINAQILSKSESTRNGLSVEEYNSWMIEADRKDRRDELNTVSALAADINEVAEQITDSTKDKADAAKATLMDKIRSIDKAIASLRSIMSVQKEYDKGTVKAIVDIANELLTSGALDGLSRGKVKKLLSIINGGAGRENMTITANRLIDLVIDNRLSFLGGLVDKFMKARTKKVNSSGVEIRGEVDAETQKVMDAFRRGMKMTETELEDAILAEMDKMSSPSETIRDNAAYELSGLQFAKRYNDEVRASVAEEAALLQEVKDTKEAHKTGLGFDSDEEYRTWEDAVRHSVRENKMERISALQKLIEDLSKIYTGGVESAKLLKQEDQARIQQIQHYANSDMQGMPASEHEIPNKALWNNSLTRFFLAPLATFDQMLRQFGRLSPSGEGYLWNHFMRKWLTSTEKEYKGVQAAHDVLDSQARAMFGGKVRRWSDLFAMSRKTSPIKAKFWDGGEMKEHVMTVGNLLYIYMVNKMTDGKTKLRKMGISEQDVVDIAASIDPQLIALADWIQETFLPGIRDKYNAVHEKLFGAPMAAIENYFPLKVNPRARTREVDTGVAETEAKPSTITGSIIKRTRNSLALDVMNVDAIDLVLEHIQQMEHWAAFAEFNQDLNALLSYRKFRTRVENMSGIYGSGTKAWQAFRHAAEMAAGVYQPASQKSTLDKAAVNIAKGVTGAKISFRVYTALKQLLSMPAFISDARIDILAKNLATPWVAWNWCMENLPLFEKRWKSRQAGDSRLMATESDWSVWKNNIVETAGRLGMSPNAFVDAFTVAVGARSIYETRKKQYLETGYSESAAEERAKQDATILFNESQQSNESAFLATVQVDRTVASVMFTVFRNSSMGYQRMYADAIRNLKHKLTKGNKAQSIEFIKKQLIRDGIEDSQAERAAERIYGRSFFKDAMRVATFGFVAQFAWNLGAYLPYLLVGDDDDEKKSMIKDAVIHGLIGGPVEGLSAGSIISEVGNMIAQGGDFKNYNPTLLPIVSDAKKVIQMFNYDEVAAVNEVFNLLIQAGLGVNPQTLTDAGVAIYDACNGDLELSKEVTLALMRILQAPQSQVDKMLADEINFKEDRGLDMTISEFAERYAKYKVLRGAPVTGWMYGDEKEKEREDKYIARFLKDAEEYKRTRGNEEAKKYYEYLDTEYKEVTETLNELKSNIKKEAMQGNEVNSLEYAKLLTEFTESDIFKRYTQFGSKAKAIEKMRDKMKKVDSYTRTSIEDAMLDLRRQMVEEMDAASQAKD